MVDSENQIAYRIAEECRRARSLHDPFNSAHEGYAVILEEMDELWDEIKKRREIRDLVKMQIEAIQIAAMAMRFVIDCVWKEGGTI
jgi:hypothetical protein